MKANRLIIYLILLFVIVCTSCSERNKDSTVIVDKESSEPFSENSPQDTTISSNEEESGAFTPPSLLLKNPLGEQIQLMDSLNEKLKIKGISEQSLCFDPVSKLYVLYTSDRISQDYVYWFDEEGDILDSFTFPYDPRPTRYVSGLQRTVVDLDTNIVYQYDDEGNQRDAIQLPKACENIWDSEWLVPISRDGRWIAYLAGENSDYPDSIALFDLEKKELKWALGFEEFGLNSSNFHVGRMYFEEDNTLFILFQNSHWEGIPLYVDILDKRVYEQDKSAFDDLGAGYLSHLDGTRYLWIPHYNENGLDFSFDHKPVLLAARIGDRYEITQTLEISASAVTKSQNGKWLLFRNPDYEKGVIQFVVCDRDTLSVKWEISLELMSNDYMTYNIQERLISNDGTYFFAKGFDGNLYKISERKS